MVFHFLEAFIFYVVMFCVLIHTVKLYALPKTEPWTLERFLDEIKTTCKESANDLHRRSVMIEDAVEDLIRLALEALNLPDPDADDGKNTVISQFSHKCTTTLFTSHYFHNSN